MLNYQFRSTLLAFLVKSVGEKVFFIICCWSWYKETNNTKTRLLVMHLGCGVGKNGPVSDVLKVQEPSER